MVKGGREVVVVEWVPAEFNTTCPAAAAAMAEEEVGVVLTVRDQHQLASNDSDDSNE